MALHLRQQMNLRMEQKLKLTPQMIQSIEILLLPQLALEERIMAEVESNPVLEIADEAEEGTPEVVEEREDAVSVADTTNREVVNDEYERMSDVDHERYSEWLKARRESRVQDEDAPDRMAAIDATAGPPPTLADHLVEQLRFMDLSDAALEHAVIICWQLDRRGYLTESLADLFVEEELEIAEQAWEAVRQCEPRGIGAKDLRDCLLLQLTGESGDNSFEIELVRHHLDDLLRNRLPVIAMAMGVEVGRVEEALQAIAHLDPSPGAPFTRSDNQIVVPDVVVERNEHDEWVVSVPDSHLPKIEINQAYYQLFERPEVTPKDKRYFREHLGSARFIIDAVAQRKRTLLRITTEIVKHQQAFLEFGPEHLRPLMRQDIADKIGMHVATVSRAVKDKYIQTPAGSIPLAQFFSGGIASSDGGEAESSRSVKLRIKNLVDQEDARKPLSDQAIADILAGDNLEISRRTVTKYRIAEGIPSTRQRRSFAKK